MEERHGHRTTMDDPLEPDDDALARREAAAAASEAGHIGGQGSPTEGDEASRPLEEAGQGVAEGFEESERELVEGATHGEARFDPERDGFSPEAESDLSTARYSEPDEIDSTNVRHDPQEGPDDPADGTDIAPDR